MKSEAGIWYLFTSFSMVSVGKQRIIFGADETLKNVGDCVNYDQIMDNNYGGCYSSQTSVNVSKGNKNHYFDSSLKKKERDQTIYKRRWMNMEDIMLHAIGQMEKDKHCITTIMWNLKISRSQKQGVEWWLPGSRARESNTGKHESESSKCLLSR